MVLGTQAGKASSNHYSHPLSELCVDGNLKLCVVQKSSGAANLRTREIFSHTPHLIKELIQTPNVSRVDNVSSFLRTCIAEANHLSASAAADDDDDDQDAVEKYHRKQEALEKRTRLREEELLKFHLHKASLLHMNRPTGLSTGRQKKRRDSSTCSSRNSFGNNVNEDGSTAAPLYPPLSPILPRRRSATPSNANSNPSAPESLKHSSSPNPIEIIFTGRELFANHPLTDKRAATHQTLPNTAMYFSTGKRTSVPVFAGAHVSPYVLSDLAKARGGASHADDTDAPPGDAAVSGRSASRLGREGQEDVPARRAGRPRREDSIGNARKVGRPRREDSIVTARKVGRPRREDSIGNARKVGRPRREDSIVTARKVGRPRREDSIGTKGKGGRSRREDSMGTKRKAGRPRREDSIGTKRKVGRPRREDSIGTKRKVGRPRREDSIVTARKVGRPRRADSDGKGKLRSGSEAATASARGTITRSCSHSSIYTESVVTATISETITHSRRESNPRKSSQATVSSTGKRPRGRPRKHPRPDDEEKAVAPALELRRSARTSRDTSISSEGVGSRHPRAKALEKRRRAPHARGRSPVPRTAGLEVFAAGSQCDLGVLILGPGSHTDLDDVAALTDFLRESSSRPRRKRMRKL
ncbi:MAG: hypothetical protein SGCHY_004987 [Lobulomycetales sp.]